MPKTSQMKGPGKFLSKDDVGRGLLLTISGCSSMEVTDGEHKWCLSFREIDKPLVLNFTNIQVCEQVCGSDDTDRWIGRQVVAYVDPNVFYGGKMVGGIRLRAPKATAPPPPPPVAEITDSDIPF